MVLKIMCIASYNRVTHLLLWRIKRMARLLHGHTVPFFLGLLSTLSCHLQTSRHKVRSDLISLSPILHAHSVSLTGHSATVNSDKVFR